MGQLTNQYVSQSYQGLLNLENTNTGLTANLQTVTDGLGVSSPLQISQTQVNISGTFTVNGGPISVDSGSFITTSSFNAYTSSVDIRFDGIEAKTGSYATTGSNQFNGNQSISGSVNISGSLTASGLNYPTADNGAKSFIQTDGAGNLSLQYVDAIYESVRNGEATQIVIGTPLFVSGSQGNSSIVYRADASNPSRMPATYVATENINPNNNGKAIILGLITGVDTNLYPAGTEVFVGSGGGWTATRPTGSAIVQSLGIVTKQGPGGSGRGVVLNPGPANLPNLPTSNLWLGDSNSYPQATPLSSLGLATTSSLSGYTTVTSFNNFTSSIDSRVDSLELETSSLQNQINQKLDTGSFNSYTSSNDAKVNSLINATGSYATTGSNTFIGNQIVTGSLDVTGEITALSASITYLETIYQTSSVIFTSGSNILGDEPSDVQTLNGTVNLPMGNLNVTGATTSSLGFFGNLQGTASFADNALSSSQAQNAVSSSHSINSDNSISSSFSQNAVSSSWSDNSLSASFAQNAVSSSHSVNSDSSISSSFAQNAVSSSHSINSDTAISASQAQNSVSSSYSTNALSSSWTDNALSSSHSQYSDNSGLLNGTGSGVFATTGSNTFLGTETITGSINVSGSANFVGDVSLNVVEPNDFKQNLILFAGKNAVTSSTILGNFLNSVTTSFDNDDINIALPLPLQSLHNQTGSIFISGSNNFIMNLGSQLPASQGRRGLLGIGNIAQSIPTINTSSLTIPQINNNYIVGPLALTNTTGSNVGNNAHLVSNNILIGNTILNHVSASIGAGQSTLFNNNINVSTLNSNISGSVLTAGSSITSNINAGLINLNHISSSINYQNNILVAGGTNVINNRYSQTGSNNSVAVSSNMFGGQGTTINVGGSPSSNVSRTIVGNLIGGQSVVVSAEASGTDLGGLRNSLLWGNTLIVSGSNSAADTNQSSVFLGRFNGQNDGLADSRGMILAVGTGTSAANRRTGFYITSGSLIGVSGSFDVKGNSTFTGSITSTDGFSGSLQGTSSYATQALTASFAENANFTLPNYVITTGSLPGNQTILGTLKISGSVPLQVGYDNVGKITTYGGGNWLYRNVNDYNTVIGNVAGVDNGFFVGSEKNMIINGFFTPFATGSNNVIIQGAGDDFISGSNNIFIGSHSGHAGGIGSVLIGSTSYSSGSIFNSKFELGTQNDSRIFHKDSAAPLQIGYDTEVTGTLNVSNGLTVSGSVVTTGSVKGNVTSLTISSNTASLDLTKGNFYTLQLVEGTDTRIEPTGISAGQTINIKINTTGSATVSFPTSVKQVSGSPYVPTATTGTDIITLVSFDNTDLYLANVKNLV